MTQITPLELSLNKGTATQISVRPTNIELYKDNCDSYWQLFNADGEQIENGNLNIPSAIYLNWAEDDSTIESYVIETLNLTQL